MSGKSDFLFSLELASSTIGLHTGKSCFKVFSKFSFERAVCLQEVYELLLLAMATELVFCLVFLLFMALRTPQESLKRYFSECSILALEKRYLEKDLFNRAEIFRHCFSQLVVCFKHRTFLYLAYT